MEWPEDLLEIFKEPEFRDVHPAVSGGNADERIKEKFQAIIRWYEENRREPSETAPRPERMYAQQLKGFRETDWKRELLRPFDQFNLLDGEV